nr:hypothetical protein [Micromonospora sp. DSM 115978]
MDAAYGLERRIARLDNEPGDSGRGGRTMAAVSAVVRVMGMVTEQVRGDPLEPERADAIVERSRVLRGLAAVLPEIVDGPLAAEAQCWIATGKPSYLPAGVPTPGIDHFADVRSRRIPAATKPFGLGLFTCTAIAGTPGMWWAYLQDHGGPNGGPFLPPWHVWSLPVLGGARVYEVTGARAWADLVAACPLRHDGQVFPDWRAIGAAYDAIHMTARAVVATQGMRLRSPAGAIAAPFWDVESTLWLRWCFGPPRGWPTGPVDG